MDQRHCYVTTTMQSYFVKCMAHLRLVLEGRTHQTVAMAKPGIIQFCILPPAQSSPQQKKHSEKKLEQQSIIEVPVNCKVLALAVLPTKHHRSDSLFVLDSDFRVAVIRVNAQRKPQIITDLSKISNVDLFVQKKLASTSYQLGLSDFEDLNVFCGVQYKYDVNDAKGIVYYVAGQHVCIINFKDRLDGLRLDNVWQGRLDLPNIKHITSISRDKFPKLKNHAGLAIVYQEDEENSHIRVFSTQPTHNSLERLDVLSIDKLALIASHAGREFVVLSSLEVCLYNYKSANKPIMTHKISIPDSIQKIVPMQDDKYCLSGDQLVLLSMSLIRQYGQYIVDHAIPVGENRLIVSSSQEDTKLIALQEDGIDELHVWPSLGQIFSVHTIQDAGEELFVTLSPNKTKKLSLLSKSISMSEIISEETEAQISAIYSISSLNKLTNTQQEYLFVSLFDDTMIQLKVTSEGFQEVFHIDFKLLAVSEDILVLEKGIFQYSLEGHSLDFIKSEQEVIRASVAGSYIAYENSEGEVKVMLKKVLTETIKVNKPLSALTASENGVIFLSLWSQNTIFIYKDGLVGSISVGGQPRDLALLNGYLLVGYSKGRVQIYNLSEANGQATGVLMQKIIAGNENVRFQKVIDPERIYCLAGKTSLLTFNGESFDKRSVALQNLSGVAEIKTNMKRATGTNSGEQLYLITSQGHHLTFSQADKTDRVSRHEIELSGSVNDFVPMVGVVGKEIHVFRGKEGQIINPYSLEKRVFSHSLDELYCIEVAEDLVVVGGVQDKNIYFLKWFQNGTERGSHPLKKAPIIIKYLDQSDQSLKVQGKSFVIAMLGELKFVEIIGSTLYQRSTCPINLNPSCLDVLPNYRKLIVSDPIKESILYDFSAVPLQTSSTTRVQPLARYFSDLRSNSVCFLGPLIINADSHGNLVVLVPNLNDVADLQKIELRVTGGIDYGQQVFQFSKASSNFGRHSVVFGTVEGTIGRVILLTEEQHHLLKQVQKLMVKMSEATGFKYFDNKRLKLSMVKTTQKSFNSAVDGDLLKRFIKLKKPEAVEILSQSAQKLDYETVYRTIQKLEKGFC